MADLTFERAFEAQYGKAVQVSPLVRRLVCRNPSAFTFHGTASYLVGDRELAVIDPGPDDDSHFSALMAAIGDRPVSHIVITHTHRDHSPLAERLKQATGAKTYGYGPHGAGARSRAVVSGDVQLDASGDMDFAPDVTLAHGDVIDGAGWDLEAVFTPGHCSNHMAFALKQENALFSGDHVMAWSTSVIAPPDGNMADYFSSLDVLLARDEEVYWPGHGPEKRDPQPFVRAFKTHRKMREEAILNRIRAGDRTVMEIVRAVYANVDARLHPAAAMSTLAHIERLIERGLIVAEGDLGVDGVFWGR